MGAMDTTTPDVEHRRVTFKGLAESVIDYAAGLDEAITASGMHTNVFAALALLPHYAKLGGKTFRRQMQIMAERYPEDLQKPCLKAADMALDKYFGGAVTMVEALMGLVDAIDIGSHADAQMLSALTLVAEQVARNGRPTKVDVKVEGAGSVVSDTVKAILVAAGVMPEEQPAEVG